MHSKKKFLFFDFDGTLIESNKLKEKGFLELFKEQKYSVLRSIIIYHRSNMGLSRFEKFKYINEKILQINYNKKIEKILNIKYSNYIKKKIKCAPLVKGCLEFLNKNFNKYSIYLCSVTIESDLLEIVKQKQLNNFFIDIKGGPIKKLEIIKKIIFQKNLKLKNIFYIGDSESDLQLAKELGISFIGVNSFGSFQFPKNIKVINDLRELESII